MGRERFMTRLGLIVGLLAITCTAPNVQACEGSYCGRLVVAAGPNFDGSWSETIVGGPKCVGTVHTTFEISNSQLVQAGCSGSVSPKGAYSGRCAGAGFTLTATGRFSGNSASGQYTRSDGCSGRWQAVRK
jgi:hypothetical protein